MTVVVREIQLGETAMIHLHLTFGIIYSGFNSHSPLYLRLRM